MSDETKEQAKEMAGFYKLHFLSDPTTQFMCIFAEDRYPQLRKMLYMIFRDKSLDSVVMDNMPPGSDIPNCHPNLVRYQYLRYIGRYGKAPPWKLVYQWILKTNQLEFAGVVNAHK